MLDRVLIKYKRNDIEYTLDISGNGVWEVLETLKEHLNKEDYTIYYKEKGFLKRFKWKKLYTIKDLEERI